MADTLNEYLTASNVRKRYGDISDMTLWRWLNDPKLHFPRPIVINRRRLFPRAELETWERARARRDQAVAA